MPATHCLHMVCPIARLMRTTMALAQCFNAQHGARRTPLQCRLPASWAARACWRHVMCRGQGATTLFSLAATFGHAERGRQAFGGQPPPAPPRPNPGKEFRQQTRKPGELSAQIPSQGEPAQTEVVLPVGQQATGALATGPGGEQQAWYSAGQLRGGRDP
jgi:hypothetical protein